MSGDDETEEPVSAWIADLGIVDRPSGIAQARASRQLLEDAAKDCLRRATDISTAHLLLMGLTTRGRGLHDASVQALESDNPFAAFTLIRSYAENAAAALYALEHPNSIDKLLGLGGQISSKKITNNAIQGSKRFGKFRGIYSALSEYTHPMSKSIFESHIATGDRGLRWSSIPAFKSDGNFLLASAWVVELAEAHGHLFAEIVRAEFPHETGNDSGP